MLCKTMNVAGQMFQNIVEEVFDIFDAIAGMTPAEWIIPIAIGVLSMGFYMKVVNKG